MDRPYNIQRNKFSMIDYLNKSNIPTCMVNNFLMIHLMVIEDMMMFARSIHFDK